MASPYAMRLATPADDEALRRMLREVSMPGAMALTSQREPDFFRAERLGNLASQVMVCAEGAERIVGFGVRSIREAFVDGEPRRIAYLSTLRSLPDARHGLLLARAYRFLRELEEADPVAASISTIYDDNRVARAILESGRAGLPAYRAIGALRTHAIGLRRARSGRGATVSAATLGAERVAAVLQRHHAAWPYAACWTADDLAGNSGRTAGFRLEDLRVVPGGEGFVASLGVWDVSAAKQTVVSSYAGPLAWYASVSAIADRLGVGPYLPPAGEPLHLLYGCALTTPDGDAAALADAVDDVVAQWSGKGYDYLLVGLPAGHPAEREVASRARLTLRSTVYRVGWDREALDARGARGRMPLLEIATL